MREILVLGGLFVCSMLVVWFPLLGAYNMWFGQGLSLGEVASGGTFVVGALAVVLLSWKSFAQRKRSVTVVSWLVPLVSVAGALAGVYATYKIVNSNPPFARADRHCLAVLIAMESASGESDIRACRPVAVDCIEMSDVPVERGIGSGRFEGPTSLSEPVDQCIYTRLSHP